MKQKYPKIGSPLRRSFDAILAYSGLDALREIWELYKNHQINADYVHGEALYYIYHNKGLQLTEKDGGNLVADSQTSLPVFFSN